MLGNLLLINLLAMALAVFMVRKQREFFRESVLMGFVLWGTGVLVATEALSLFHGLGFWEIFIWWILTLVLCTVFILKNFKGLNIRDLFSQDGDFSGDRSVKPWPFLEKVAFNRVVVFSFSLGVIALLSAPNTSDSMTYHMARVMHWIQNHSVAYYPTHIPRQLYMPSFSEYIILHFQLLSAGDRWANFVQWLSMCGSLVSVSLIAKELGAQRRGQILAALIAVTIPMGILQSTSTQTDYVETLWIASFIYFILRWHKTAGLGYAVWAGAGLGLAVDTKGMALIISGPFLLWMILENVRPINFKKLMTVVLMLCLAGLFYAGSYYRNAVFFHGNATKVVSADADSLVNNRFCWEGFEANLLRNMGLHLITPSWSVNKAIKEDIYKFASWIQIDLNNKDWSYVNNAFPVIDFRGNEDYLGNPWHLLLILIVTGIFIISPRFRGRDAGFYLIAVLGVWLAFSAILKWQPWHSRFHLPIFVILAPLAGFVIEKINVRWLVSGIMGGLFISAWIILLVDVSKPILSPMSIFYPQDRDALHFIFADSPQTTYMAYQQIAAILKKMNCKNIGLIMGNCEREYLLWVALNPSADSSMRIESVLVNNSSAGLKYPLGGFSPDAIITLDDQRPWVIVAGSIYPEVWNTVIQGKKISILLKSQ